MSRLKRHSWVSYVVFFSLIVLWQPASAQNVDSVSATGPELGSTLEDRVEITWIATGQVPQTSSFVVRRWDPLAVAADSIIIGVVASTVFLFDDFNARPSTEYHYCVSLRSNTGVESGMNCDVGMRQIFRPTGFEATDGWHEEWVALSWSDRSQIENGYNIYRDAGNALNLDGIDDRVTVFETLTMPASFTVEFWARRGSSGGNQFIWNLRNLPAAAPSGENLEIGFNSSNRFVVGFGNDQLLTPGIYTDSDWHHWAVTYDAASRRRTIYVDGIEEAFDTYGQSFQSSGELEFGRQSRTGNSARQGFFEGQIDELRMWSRQLGPIEIPPLQTQLLHGDEPGLAALLPMDVQVGSIVPDVIGSLSGVLNNQNGSSPNWVPTGLGDLFTQIPANLTAYNDRATGPGYESYTYRIGAFQDVDGDGFYTPGVDYESEQRTETGWRGLISPPDDVVATDGQFLDRVRITWIDRSNSETSFRVYRDGGLIGTTPSDSTLYDDFTAVALQTYEYCIAASYGPESTRICDLGRVGGLPEPDSVAATDRTFDDRVLVSWVDTTDTEGGFEVFRDGVLVGTTGENAEEFNDFNAVQEVDYTYCVRAFSEMDPGNPSFSAQVCGASTGARAAVLAPERVAASDDEFEDRVEIAWSNPSTTAMLFKVYRDNNLVEVLDHNMTRTTDSRIASGQPFEYCVASETVVLPSGAASPQGRVSQVLENIRYEDRIRVQNGGVRTEPDQALSTVYQSLGFTALGKNSATGADRLVESAKVCDPGSRFLRGPTQVDASDGEFEDFVQVTWVDNSQFESGFTVLRNNVPLDTLSANRTSYRDYTGADKTFFSYKVRAFDSNGSSVPGSSQDQDEDSGHRLFKQPTGLQASDGVSERFIDLEWTDNSDAEKGYIIRRQIFSGANLGPIQTVDTTRTNEVAYTDTLVGSPGQVRYSVFAFNDFGESLPARDDGFTRIEAPADVNASDTYTDRVTIVWVDRSNIETGYRLTRRTVGGFAVEIDSLLSANMTMYTDLTAAPNTEYQYCVRAESGPGVASIEACDVGHRLFGSGGPPTTPGLVALKFTSEYTRGSSRVDEVRFGASVALGEGVFFVGAPGAYEVYPGAFEFLETWGRVSDYRKNVLSGVWSSTDLPPDPGLEGPEERFNYGHALDYDAPVVIIGDPMFMTFSTNEKQGAVEIYGGSFDRRLVQSATTPQEFNFGSDVAVSGDWVIIGNPDYGLEGVLTPSDPPGNGQAWVCSLLTPCTSFVELESVVPVGDRRQDLEFGHSVDITRIADTLYALVGAPGNDQAWIFRCGVGESDCRDTSDWSILADLNTRFPPGGRFGAEVAIGEKIAAIGAPGAEGFVLYEFVNGEWVEQFPFSERGAKAFGSAIAIHDTTFIVGAPFEKVGGIDDAGAVYVFEWKTQTRELSTPLKYDARVGTENVSSTAPPGKVLAGALFGSAVDISSTNYLVGAPHDEDGFFQDRDGAAYLIPVGLEPPGGQIVPGDVSLVEPSNVEASDGSADDRIQIRWDDNSDGEDGHIVFRSKPGGDLEILKEVEQNIETFDDFQAAPGDAYKYCVAAFFGDARSTSQCDIGWRQANGTIAGRLAAREGGGTEDASVCLSPSPARALLFDGFRGHVKAPLVDELDFLNNDFTLEAWIRPHAIDGERYILSKDGAWALAVNNGRLRFRVFPDDIIDDGQLPLIGAGTWYHVAVSMDRDKKVTFYLDDELPAPFLGSSPPNASLNGDMLTIAQRGNGTGFFKGEIDDVRIWDRARPDSLIVKTSRMELQGDEENLVGYWPLDQGEQLVVPDVAKFANHGEIIGGAYVTEKGAPMTVCAPTEGEGNFSFSDIRYGASTEFQVIPTKARRVFEPSFKKITLTTESPVQNEVDFIDATAYSMAGVVQYRDVVNGDTLSCAVPNVRIHADKSAVPTDNNVRTSTRGDGSYTVGLDPSRDNQDFWHLIPTLVGPDDDQIEHEFSPAERMILSDKSLAGLDFEDVTRHDLSGHVSGGDPATCGRNIGKVVVRTFTQDGCYSRVDTVDTAENNGQFSFDLPPLEYLMEVVEVIDAPSDREDDIKSFFENLGAVELDMRADSVERNLIYRAPLTLAIDGFSGPSCPNGQIVQRDEDGDVLRLLPAVPRIGAFEFRPLTIRVEEDYGNDQVCAVDEGQVAIFDAIADRVDVDTTIALENGVVNYTTFGASPNIFSGARIQGVDRSFQKPITVVAQVEGREFLTETRWALVEGFRERSATFVSATTEEFPLMILHDPPGSNSYAFIEAGSSMCSSVSNTELVGGGAGLEGELVFGFKTKIIAGATQIIETRGGVTAGLRVFQGQDVTSLVPGLRNREICVSVTETLTTSDDPTWVGEDIHVGVALNLIFAIADVLDYDSQACSVELSETLAADFDASDPFETTYAYGTSHIELSLIPELENLIKLAGGEATVEGDIDGEDTNIRLNEALQNWRKQLDNNERLQAEALENPRVNRSFSGGTEFAFSEAADTTKVTRFESTRIYFDGGGHIGGVIATQVADIVLNALFEVRHERVSEIMDTEGTSGAMGYVLKDGDTGDFFSVDIAKDPRFNTFVFGTRSGRSSNPHEANTQKRDLPILHVDPPVLFNVDPEDAGAFELTLINASESNERRRYTMAIPGETNRQNLGVTVTGDLLGGSRLESFLLDPGKAITINMDVFPAPNRFAYEDVGVVLYPEDEFNVWLADVRQPFALADTAFFSVYFDSTRGKAMSASLASGWNWFSTNREGGELNSVLADLPATDGDLVRSQEAESRFDSTVGWNGTLTALVPGEGYRIRLQEPHILRFNGEAVENSEPIVLESGWNWIGYLPSKRLAPNDALTSLADRARQGDIIVGQDQFAQFVSGVGWVGTLEEMNPGESYAIDLALGGKLFYPTSYDDVDRPTRRARLTTTLGPEWDVESEHFDGAMSMVAEVRMSGVPTDQEATKVAVFAGDSLRGVGHVDYIEQLDRYLAFVMIFGHEGEDEPEALRVHVYDGAHEELYEDVGSLEYAAQTMIGQPVDPVVLELTAAGTAPMLLEVPEEFKLYGNYPNPFNPTTTITYDVPEPAHVNLIVFDILGRQVVTITDREHRAGRHKVSFDGRLLASGFYLYRLEAGDYKEVRKMILVK